MLRVRAGQHEGHVERQNVQGGGVSRDRVLVVLFGHGRLPVDHGVVEPNKILGRGSQRMVGLDLQGEVEARVRVAVALLISGNALAEAVVEDRGAR